MKLTQLNEDSLLSIFRQLPFTILRTKLRLVSTRWNNLAEQVLRQAKSLKLFDSRFDVGKLSILSYHLPTQDQVYFAPKKNENIIKFKDNGDLQSLEPLPILLPRLSKLILVCKCSTLDRLSALLRQWPDLVNLSLIINICPTSTQTFSWTPLFTALNSLKSLRRLDLYLHAFNEQDEVIPCPSLNFNQVSEQLAFLSRLEHFFINDSLSGALDDLLPRLSIACKHLHAWNLSRIETLSSLTPSLTHLSLFQIEGTTIQDIIKLLGVISDRFPHLEYLSLSLKCEKFSEITSSHLSKLKNLRDLRILNCYFNLEESPEVALPSIRKLQLVHYAYVHFGFGQTSQKLGNHLLRLFPGVDEIELDFSEAKMLTEIEDYLKKNGRSVALRTRG